MEHVEQFIKHGLYLKGWSTRTVRTYRQAFSSLQQSLRSGDAPNVVDVQAVSPPELTKAQLQDWVIWLKERGLTPGGCNMYIRTINSYLSWLHQEELAPERLRLKLLPDPKKPLNLFSEAEIRCLLAHKPVAPGRMRTWVLIQLLLDTGCRIEEALTLTWASVNLDDLVLTVLGKGNRTRLVPMSVALRRVLFRYQRDAEGSYVFSAGPKTRLEYRNAYRDIKNVCKDAGVEGKHVHPHAFRHFFAVHYIRSGGDIYRLSRILGHSSINTTQLYLRSMGIEMIQEGHRSVLSQVR